VVIGFTNGIAVLIASTQIKDFFGLTVEAMPGELGRLIGGRGFLDFGVLPAAVEEAPGE
jgi:SulP family sulfate permease